MAKKRGQPASGAVIRAARIMAGMKQADLARAAGLHLKSVAYWERRGSRGVFGEQGFRRIVEALRGVGIEIMRGDGEGVRRISAPVPTATTGGL